MDTQERRMFEKGFASIVKSIEALGRTVRETSSVTQPQRVEELYAAALATMQDMQPVSNGVEGVTLPVEIDWFTPPCKTSAQFSWDSEGRLDIHIKVEGEDADIIRNAIPTFDVESLQLMSVPSDNGD